jgi:hypothetical protein
MIRRDMANSILPPRLLKLNRRGISRGIAGLIVFIVILAGPNAIAQQAEPSERVYAHSQIEVEKALQDMRAFETYRLPTLDGFVGANADTLDHLENPHYQLRVDVFSQGAAQTLVRVSAKITAWHTGEDAAHSQYTLVPSNGRLEDDFLDRLSLYLEKGGAPMPSASSPAPAASAHSSASSADAPPAAGGGSHSPRAATSSPPPPGPPAGTAPVGPDPSADAATLAARIDAVKLERQAVEDKQRKLEQEVAQLESDSKSERYLSNVAVIKDPQAAVFELNDETSRVLFRTDPDDEFEVIDVKESWVHIRLENGGQGWLRGSQLQSHGTITDTDDPAAANFSTPNEEIKPFAGDWAPLKGKPALFVFAQPARAIPDAMLGQSQLKFAQHIFVEGYREATHSQETMAGVVVVFLGPKGGVAAATLPDIRRWRENYLTDKQFLDRCSLDPPESFRDAPKH